MLRSSHKIRLGFKSFIYCANDRPHFLLIEFDNKERCEVYGVQCLLDVCVMLNRLKMPSVIKSSRSLSYCCCFLSGKAVGLVTTTRVTHATPAALYAHTPERNWENDADIDDHVGNCTDIAAQLIDANIDIQVSHVIHVSIYRFVT
jgi:hypothetical protein